MIESYEKTNTATKISRGGVFFPYLGFYSEFSPRGSKLDKVSDNFT
jgi:hypothetical protein